MTFKRGNPGCPCCEEPSSSSSSIPSSSSSSIPSISSSSISSTSADPCNCDETEGLEFYVKVTVNVLKSPILIPWTTSPCCTRLLIEDGPNSNGTYFMRLKRMGCPGGPIYYEPWDTAETQALSSVDRTEYNFSCTSLGLGTFNGAISWQLIFSNWQVVFSWGPVGFGSVEAIGGQSDLLLGCPNFRTFSENKTVVQTGDGVNCASLASEQVTHHTFEFMTLAP